MLQQLYLFVTVQVAELWRFRNISVVEKNLKTPFLVPISLSQSEKTDPVVFMAFQNLDIAVKFHAVKSDTSTCDKHLITISVDHPIVLKLLTRLKYCSFLSPGAFPQCWLQKRAVKRVVKNVRFARQLFAEISIKRDYFSTRVGCRPPDLFVALHLTGDNGVLRVIHLGRLEQGLCTFKIFITFLKFVNIIFTVCRTKRPLYPSCPNISSQIPKIFFTKLNVFVMIDESVLNR